VNPGQILMLFTETRTLPPYEEAIGSPQCSNSA
jgi:hypothetical protein